MAATYTSEQQRIIDLDEGAYVVSAPPGAGKTQVLVERSIRLLTESPGGSFRILALTFTTRAADELRERVAVAVQTEWRRMTTRTFHAFALDVLGHYGERIGVAPNLTVFESDDDRLESLAQALSEEGFGFGREAEDVKTLRTILGRISKLKRALVPPEATPPEKVDGVEVGVAYEAYARKLGHLGAADFDDLLLLANRLFAEHPRIARHYRRMYRFVLIDEAQDTSRAQYELLRGLLGDEHRNVLMVADTDQAIFGFAGSSSRYVTRFVEDFGAQRLELTSNFRCASSVVEAAGRLIAHNPETRRPEVVCVGDATGVVQVVEAQDEQAEATDVVAELQRLLSDGLRPQWLMDGEPTALRPEDTCILGRSRYALDATVAALRAAEVPFQFGSGSSGLFDTALFRGLQYALRVTNNPRDLLSVENLAALLEPGDDAERERRRTQPAGELLGALADAAEVQVDLSGLEHATASAQALEAALEPFVALAEHNGSVSEEYERLARDATTLRDRWRAYGRSSIEDRSLTGFLSHLSLAGRASLSDPGVRVLTVQAVKGLEFRAVFVIGMNEGTFPDYRSVNDPEAVADERRIAYVALTRASRYLRLSRPRTRKMPWGDIREQRPSRFLVELAA